MVPEMVFWCSLHSICFQCWFISLLFACNIILLESSSLMFITTVSYGYVCLLHGLCTHRYIYTYIYVYIISHNPRGCNTHTHTYTRIHILRYRSTEKITCQWELHFVKSCIALIYILFYSKQMPMRWISLFYITQFAESIYFDIIISFTLSITMKQITQIIINAFPFSINVRELEWTINKDIK